MHTAGIAGRPRRGCDPRILAAAGAIPDADAVVDGQVYGGAPRERVSACMLASLLRWARAEGLLAGQHDRMRDAPRAWFRKNVAHPTSYHLQGPDHAEWAIADFAQIINRIWGAPSGRPVRREIMMIAWTDDTVAWNAARWFTPPRTGPGGWAYVIVLADPEEPGFGDYDVCDRAGG